MSEELFNSASCSGDCTSCGSDCQDLDQPTVTLTLDDDTEVKCAVLTIFPAPNQKEYIALCTAFLHLSLRSVSILLQTYNICE